MFTMSNADTGSTGGGGSGGSIKIDLTNYALKADTATKVDLEALKTTVANKIDKEPQHHHKISEIDELQTELNSKYDLTQKYSYNVILSDSEKIPYLENTKILTLDITKSNTETKILTLDITKSNTESGYVFKVDSSTGDLQILKNSVIIMSYNAALSHWIINDIDLNNFITNVNDVLTNHYQALSILMGKHDITDSDTNDGNKFTPNA